jgi:AcrR family transcriptional regulator
MDLRCQLVAQSCCVNNVTRDPGIRKDPVQSAIQLCMLVYMEGQRRDYRMQKRKENVDETRQRIVEAAVRLHGSVGPAHTTFSAVAEAAGVQRSTVYRHFADEAALFGACTSHWMAAHPWPRPRDWAEFDIPAERVRHGLTELYTFYAENEQMIANSFRDIEAMPPFVGEMMGALLAEMAATLLRGFGEAAAERRLSAAVRAALDFRTASALGDAGFSPAEAADLMAEMISGVTAARR